MTKIITSDGEGGFIEYNIQDGNQITTGQPNRRHKRAGIGCGMENPESGRCFTRKEINSW
jgi:hypothetical protein